MRASAVLLLSLTTLSAAAPSWWSTNGLLTGFREDMATAALTPRQVTAPAKCVKGVHIIGVSGAGAPSIGNYGYLKTLVSNISAIIPKSDNITLPYDKASQEFIGSTTDGVRAIPC